MTTFLSIIFTFSIVVFVHELGHFIMAMRSGVKVYTFSLGFGPELLGITHKGVRYRLSAFPLGGYVKMKGEDPEEEGSREDDAFMGLEPLKRIKILVAGPFMNFVTAMLIFSFLIFFTGIPRLVEKPVIGAVSISSPADRAGLRGGDMVLTVDGNEISNWRDITTAITNTPDSKRIVVQRAEEILEFDITPEMNEDIGRMLIGISQSYETVKLGFFRSLLEGSLYTIMLSYRMLESLWLMASGQLHAAVAGPVGIGQLISQAAHEGLIQLFQLIAFISLNLGLINLFPIPILDGGHVVLALIEKIKGSPLDSKKVNIANLIGLSLILAIFVMTMWSDTVRLIAK